MYLISFISKRDLQIIQMIQLLKTFNEFSCALYSRPELAIQGLRSSKSDAWVVYLSQTGLRQIDFLKRLRDVIPMMPIVVVAKTIDPEFLRFVESQRLMMVLRKDTEFHNLPGILTKMIRGSQVKVREFSRVRVTKGAEFKLEGRECEVADISNNGAGVSWTGRILNRGDKISFEVHLPKLGVRRIVECMVMWTRQARTLTGAQAQQQMGVRFLSQRLDRLTSGPAIA